MSINIKNYISEIRNIMSSYPQHGLDPEYIKTCNGSLKNWFQDHKIDCIRPPNKNTLASAISRGKANGVLIKAIITEDEIANAKGAIGFDKRTKLWDSNIVKKLLPSLNTNKKFIQHLILHEIAHHSGFSQEQEYKCDKWAFEEMEKCGWLTP